MGLGGARQLAQSRIWKTRDMDGSMDCVSEAMGNEGEWVLSDGEEDEEGLTLFIPSPRFRGGALQNGKGRWWWWWCSGTMNSKRRTDRGRP